MSSDSNIHIQIATEYDVKNIANITRKSFIQYCSAIGIDTVDALQESDKDILDDIRKKIVYKIYWKERIVGSIRVEIKSEKATISRFSILPEYQCLGIGSKMLSFVEQILVFAKIDWIELYSAVDNKRLKDFYISKGYKILSIDNSKGYRRGLFQKKL